MLSLFKTLLLALAANLVHGQDFNEDYLYARGLWDAATGGEPTDYSYEYIADGSEGGLPMLIDVRSDVIVSVTESFPNIGDQFNPLDYPTVPAMFDKIALALDPSVDVETGGILVDAQFDADYGYPTSFIIVYSELETDGGDDSVNATNATDAPTPAPLTPPFEVEIQEMTLYSIAQSELNDAKFLWESFPEMTKHYTFVIQEQCFCFFDYVTPKTLVVEDDVITAAADATGRETFYAYDTISELFDRIQESITNYDVYIDVSFNSEYGYPELYSYLPGYDISADASRSITVTDMVFFETMTPSLVEETAVPSLVNETAVPSFFNETAVPSLINDTAV